MILRRSGKTPFKFDSQKAIQAVAFLLKQRHETNCSDNYMRVLKLLYFAERESLSETGRPITGDSFVAMKNGPTLSHLLDSVNQRGVNNKEWDKYILREGYNIRLIQDPGNGKLCRYEIDLLKKICEEYREKSEWDIVEESHKLPEWQKNNPGESSKAIPLSDLLEAVGRLDWLEDIIQMSQERTEIGRVLRPNF